MINNSNIKLKVAGSIQSDINRGVVRLDSNIMTKYNIQPGDIIQIEGKSITGAIVERALPGDTGLRTIRMDSLTRRNAKISNGEEVLIKKIEADFATKVSINLINDKYSIKINPTLFNKLLKGRPIVKGDIFSLGNLFRRKNTDPLSIANNDFLSISFSDIKFIVSSTIPKTGIHKIGPDTKIEFSTEIIDKEITKIPDICYEDVGGLDKEISIIREMIEIPLKYPEIFEKLGIEPPKGVLLYGPPGTGKTLLAKAVASETNSNFILINGPEIMSKFYGESEANLRKKFEEAEKNAPSIIFIDEIDAIAPKREESKGEVERRVVAQLLTIMDGMKTRGKVVVIGATNIPNAIDPALRRPGRFDRELEIGALTKEGRENVLKIHTRNMPLSDDVDLKKIAENAHGFVGADIASLCKEVGMTVLRKIIPELKKTKEGNLKITEEILNKLLITSQDFEEARKVIKPSALREVSIEAPNVKWEDVGGLEEVKQELKEAVEWPLKHKDKFKELGIKPPKGILLYGPPGTGKTLLAKAIANETKANFISIKGPELLSRWVGESEKAVRKIFEKARQSSPSIIFFDEIDSIAPIRTSNSGSVTTERVVNQLLTEINGIQELKDIVIIAATNRPDIIDTALLRPGRFDRIILVNTPDKETRKSIFKVHLKNMPLSSNIDIEYLSENTEGYVGADIEAICREAAIFAMRENIETTTINIEHFKKALKKVTPSVSKKIKEAYEELKYKFSQSQGKKIIENKPNYYG